MQPALQETYEEVSGVYRITPEGPVAVERLHRWFPTLKRPGRIARYIESAVVTATVVGLMGLSVLLVAAHYDSVRSAAALPSHAAP